MLKCFSVEGYRCFGNKVELNFSNPHDYNWHNDSESGDSYITNGIINNALILGENATGKTNLGRALMDIKSSFRRMSLRQLVFDGEGDPSYLNGDNDQGFARFEYVFYLRGADVTYMYHKDDQEHVLYEKLLIDDQLIFESDTLRKVFDGSGLPNTGNWTLNWDFSDDELCVLAYLSNSLPRAESPIIYELRKYVEHMSMISAPRSTPHSFAGTALRRIASSKELVEQFERFLRDNGVDERLEVIESPDGEPVLYFSHNRPIPFARACSSGTLTLLSLFSRFFMRQDDSQASLVYIDEFDAYLHFDVADRLVRSFGSFADCQTVCSTHNTSLVRNVTMRPDCVFQITREYDNQGDKQASSLLIKPFADRTQRELRRMNNVEHLYRNGEFD